jgi:transposase
VLDPEELSRVELVALVREQATLLASQAALVAEQAAELLRLRAEVERLRRLTSRNSGNSSMPPSTDDLPGRKKPARRAKPDAGGAKRKRGKQRGAAGTSLPWVEDAEVVDHRPDGACECGADLAGATDEGVDQACQVTDVPLVTARTTEHRMHQVRCGCGKAHVAAPPAGAGTANTRVYGPNLRTLVVYLLVFQHVPVHRCVQLVADLTGVAPSVGFVHGMLGRCADALGEAMQLIKTLVTLAHVAHFDETTLRVGKAGVKKYVWSASTNAYTVFALGRRSGKQFRLFNVGTRFRGVAVHDRYGVYDMSDVFADEVRHQLCASHLIRDLTDAAESYPHAVWPTQCKRALQGLIHAANTARDAGHREVDPDLRERLIGEFRQGVLVGLKEVPRQGGPNTKQLPARSLLEDLRDRHDDVMRFCFDTKIPATNNQAERDLRPTKTQQKISGRLTSDDATMARLTIRGYISTAIKHGVNVLHVLRTAITGQPWIPPAAAGLARSGP